MVEQELPSSRPEGIPSHLRKKAEEVEQAFLERLRQGQLPDREAVLARNPEVAPWLGDHLALLEIIYSGGEGSEGDEGGFQVFVN